MKSSKNGLLQGDKEKKAALILKKKNDRLLKKNRRKEYLLSNVEKINHDIQEYLSSFYIINLKTILMLMLMRILKFEVLKRFKYLLKNLINQRLNN